MNFVGSTKGLGCSSNGSTTCLGAGDCIWVVLVMGLKMVLEVGELVFHLILVQVKFLLTKLNGNHKASSAWKYTNKTLLMITNTIWSLWNYLSCEDATSKTRYSFAIASKSSWFCFSSMETKRNIKLHGDAPTLTWFRCGYGYPIK